MLALWKTICDKHRWYIKKKSHYLLTKICLVKVVAFPVVMYRCESWTLKKAECQILDAFKFCCWGRLLRFPWIVRRSKESILKEIKTKYSLEGLMLKLKLQYFHHLMWTVNQLEKTPMLRKIEGGRHHHLQEGCKLCGILRWELDAYSQGVIINLCSEFFLRNSNISLLFETFKKSRLY